MAGRGIEAGSPEALATWALIDFIWTDRFPAAIAAALAVDLGVVYLNFLGMLVALVGTLADEWQADPARMASETWSAWLPATNDIPIARLVRAAIADWDENATADTMNLPGMLDDAEPPAVLTEFSTLTHKCVVFVSEGISETTNAILNGVRMRLGA